MRDLAVVQPMPPLDADAPALSAFEFWPAPVFYAPLMPLIGWLMLRHGVTAPLAANPGLPASGLVGESKSEVFSAFTGPQRELLASWIVVERTGSIEWQARDIERRMTEAGFGYPAVAKPDIGCRGAGVRPLHNRLDLIDYLWAFPRDGRLVIQQMVRADGEAGIFYVRRPGDRRGRIISLTLKYFPHVFGDGQATLEQLIQIGRAHV